MKNMPLLPSIVIAASALSAPAQARPAPDPAPQEVVTYGDLDLNSPAARSRLEWRLRSAASRLCTADERAVPTPEVDQSCFRAAMADAHRQFGEALARSGGAALAVSASIVLMRP